MSELLKDLNQLARIQRLLKKIEPIRYSDFDLYISLLRGIRNHLDNVIRKTRLTQARGKPNDPPE